MALYEIYFKESVRKDLRRIPNSDLKRIMDRIEKLERDPRPAGCEKLAGTGEGINRVRQGDYRIVYTIQDQALTIWIIKVGQRKNIYR